MKLKRFLISLIFSFTLLLAGCSNFLSSIYVYDGRTDDYVTLTGIMENYRAVSSQKSLYSSQGNARSINPEISVYDYDFYLFGQADYTNTDNVIGPFPVTLTTGTAEDPDDENQGTFTCKIPSGMWYLTLAAFKSESNGGTKPEASDLKYFYTNDESHTRPLLAGSAICDVSQTNATKPRFTLSPEGLTTKGNVNLQIKLDGWNILNADNSPANGFENIGAKAEIKSLNYFASNPVIAPATDISFSNEDGTDCASYNVSDIGSGTFEFNLIFYNKNDESQTWVWSDTITVFPGRDTEEKVYIPEINLSSGNPPEAPSDFKVSHYKTTEANYVSSDGLYYATIFEWTDNSYTENGFEIRLIDIDDNNQTISFDKNIETYISNYVEGALSPNKNTVTIRIPFGHRYHAQIRAVNQIGESIWIDAELKTTDLDSKAEAFRQIGTDSTADEWNALNMYKVTYFLNGGELTENVSLNGQTISIGQKNFIQYGPLLSGDFNILDKEKASKGINKPDHWSRSNSKEAAAETATTYDGYKNLSLWAIYPENVIDDEEPAPPLSITATPYETSVAEFLSNDGSSYGVIFKWECDDDNADFEIRLRDVNTNESILMNKYIVSDSDRYISVTAPDESSLSKGSRMLHAYVPFGSVYSVEIRSIKGSNKSHKDNEPWIQAADTINMFKVQYNLSGGYANISGTSVYDPVFYGSPESPVTILDKTVVSRSTIHPDKFYTEASLTNEFTEISYGGYENLELWAHYQDLITPSNFKISHYKTDDPAFLSANGKSYACIFEWDYPDSEPDFRIKLTNYEDSSDFLLWDKNISTQYKISGDTTSLSKGNRKFKAYVPFGKRYKVEIQAIQNQSESDWIQGEIKDTGFDSTETGFVRQNSIPTSDEYNLINLFKLQYEFNGGYNWKEITLRNDLIIPAPSIPPEGNSEAENPLETNGPYVYYCNKSSLANFIFAIPDTDKESIFILEDNNPKFFKHWGINPISSEEYNITSHNGYSNLVLWAQYEKKETEDTTGERAINSTRLKYKVGNTTTNVPNEAFIEASGTRIEIKKGTSITFTLAPTTKRTVSLTNVDSFLYTDLSVKVLNNKDRIINTNIEVENDYAVVRFLGIVQTGYNSTHTWTIDTSNLEPGNYSIVIEGKSNSYNTNMNNMSETTNQVATVFFTVTN